MRTIIMIIILACVAVTAAYFLHRFKIVVSESEAMAVPREEPMAAWREDFNKMPEQSRVKGKPGTPLTVFTIEKDDSGGFSFLHAEADKATASLVFKPGNIDLEKTPLLKWKWRATVLPQGGDGRSKDKDDQAIGIYVGAGSMLGNKSISYRWDTDTPKGAEGSAVYGAGTVKVKWITLRNKEDFKIGQWYVEQRNVAEDFKKMWGSVPDKIYLSVCCNSQYTGTEAAADLSWMEFTSLQGNNKTGNK